MKVTASAKEYKDDLLANPARAIMLFLDVFEEMFRDHEDVSRIKKAAEMASLTKIPADDKVSAFRWLREMSTGGLNETL